MQEIFRLLNMASSNSDKNQVNSSKLYFVGVDSASGHLKSIKELLEKLLEITCLKCDAGAASACKCKTAQTEFEHFFQKLIFPTVASIDALKDSLKEIGGGKSVCGKVLKSKDIGFKCLDCELDPTCIICQECFEKSDHKGHRTIQQSSCAGCCDCGDREAWKPEGFCSDHKGFQGNILEKVQALPEDFRLKYFEFFRILFFLFFLGCEDFFTRFGLSGVSTKLSKFWKLILKLLKTVNKSNNFVLNALLFELLRCPLSPSSFKLSHECQNYETIYLLNSKNTCTCSVLENLFRFNLFLDKSCQKEIVELCFELFEFYEFKKVLIVTYARMLPFFFFNSKKKQPNSMDNFNNPHSTILDLNVQLFTSDELTKLLIENDAFEHFLDFLVKELAKVKRKSMNFDFMKTRLEIHHIENISSKPFLCKFLCQKPIFFDRFFEILASINHVASHDQEDSKDQSEIEQTLNFLELELILLGILRKMVSSGINALETKEREPFLDYLLSKLIKLMSKDEENCCEAVSFHIPLQRAFSQLLSAKLYYNPGLFKIKDLTQYLMSLGFGNLKSLEGFLIGQFVIVSKVLLFMKEIQKGYWKEYSNLLGTYPNAHSKSQFQFHSHDTFLFQVLLALLSDEKNVLLDYFLRKNEKVGQFLKFISEKEGRFESEAVDLFEELLNILLLTISKINIPLINEWSILDANEKNEKTKAETIKVILQGILTPVNTMDIKTLKLQAFNMISDNYKLEPVLEEVASFDKKSKLFKLKSNKINEFDPFIFLKDHNFWIETMQNLGSRFKDREILGLECDGPTEGLNPLQKQCMEIIAKALFITLIRLCQQKDVINHMMFLKKTLKLFYELLDYLISKDDKNVFLILKNETSLRDSLAFIEKSNAFPNIKLSIECIMKKIDLVSKKLPELKAKTSSEEEKFSNQLKKEVFLQKQKELKEKFLAQQAKFLQKNQEFLDEEFKASHQQVVCAICKEELNDSLPYGQMAYLSRSNVYKHARYQQLVRVRLAENDKGLLQFIDGIDRNSKIFNKMNDQYFFTSCFHYLHHQCFKDFMKKNHEKGPMLETFEYKCPLCTRLSNIFIPFGGEKKKQEFNIKFWKKDIELDLDLSISLVGSALPKAQFQGDLDLYNDIMVMKCLMDDGCSSSVNEILENALLSVIESLQINGFNYFLNKQLLIYKNLLFLYQRNSNIDDETRDHKEFLARRKAERKEIGSILLNKAGDYSFLMKNVETLFSNYAILSFVSQNWQPEDLFRHLSAMFEHALFWVKVQFLLKGSLKNMKDYSTVDKEFTKVHLRMVQSLLSISFMMFDFDEAVLKELNNKSFSSDDDELIYLQGLLPIPRSAFLIDNTALIDHHLKESLLVYSQKSPDEKALILYQALVADQDLSFQLYELESRFTDLMTLFSGRKCELCHSFSKIGELSLCLVCGAAICNRLCSNDKHQEKGNLNQHSIENHCGNCVFISFPKCEVFLISSPKNFTEKSHLFADKYGQGIKLKSSDWGSFCLNSEEYNLLKEILVKNSVAQEIFYRSRKQNIYYKNNVF